MFWVHCFISGLPKGQFAEFYCTLGKHTDKTKCPFVGSWITSEKRQANTPGVPNTEADAVAITNVSNIQ